MSITMKALLITALGGTTGIVGWAVTRPAAEAEPDASGSVAAVAAPEREVAAPEDRGEASEPEVKGAAPEADDARARWQRRVESIRSRLPAADGAAEPPPARLHEPDRDGALRELRTIVDACMEDLGERASGSVTLSVRELGAPDVGTIYAAIDVVDASFDEPEVIECLTQSMYDHVGTAPAEPFERVIAWTIPLGEPQTPEDADAKTFGYIVGAHMGEVRFCESKAEGNVMGTVSVAITIGASGQPEVSVAEPSALPEAVVDCIVGATKRWVFPKKLAGKRFERAFVLPVPGEPVGPVGDG